ncbi:unnamed protein product, partial [Medioppia subpectinata]
MAPEINLGVKYTGKVDVFSLGIAAHELFGLDPDDVNDMDVYSNHVFHKNIIKLEQLLTTMVDMKPHRRPDLYYYVASAVTAITGAKRAPNVILFVADDMGWADVGYHSDHILTPNIDSLAADGVLLNHFYAQPICSPSRGALLTAVHPIHLGLQNSIIYTQSPTGLPLERNIWPQYLKQRDNYATHIV